jgi:hypothetical protein
MSNQSLDNGEVLNVKWSQEDQNPMAQSREIVEKKQKLIHNMEKSGIDTKQVPFSYPTNYQVPNPKGIDEKLKQIEAPPVESSEEKKLDFTSYVHATFKEARLEEKKREEVDKLWNEEKEKLNSNVVAPYPDTDKQFYNQFSQQLKSMPQQDPKDPKGTQVGNPPVDLSFYTNYDPQIYQEYAKENEK